MILNLTICLISLFKKNAIENYFSGNLQKLKTILVEIKSKKVL
jgi:hypothetical protein